MCVEVFLTHLSMSMKVHWLLDTGHKPLYNHVWMHSHTHTHSCSCTHTCSHTRTHSHTLTHTHAHTQRHNRASTALVPCSSVYLSDVTGSWHASKVLLDPAEGRTAPLCALWVPAGQPPNAEEHAPAAAGPCRSWPLPHRPPFHPASAWLRAGDACTQMP